VSYQVQVRNVGGGGTWAGRPLGRQWVPAIDGTLNSTGLTSDEASTFDDLDVAQVTECMVRRELANGDADEEGHAGYETRITEVTEKRS
jgi:hypothetical protein